MTVHVLGLKKKKINNKPNPNKTKQDINFTLTFLLTPTVFQLLFFKTIAQKCFQGSSLTIRWPSEIVKPHQIWIPVNIHKMFFERKRKGGWGWGEARRLSEVCGVWQVWPEQGGMLATSTQAWLWKHDVPRTLNEPSRSRYYPTEVRELTCQIQAQLQRSSSAKRPSYKLLISRRASCTSELSSQLKKERE